MKTAISVPDDVYGEVEARAHRLGLNRSQAYTTALREWLRATAEEGEIHPITAELNGIYGQPPDADELADRAFAREANRLAFLRDHDEEQAGGW